MSSTCLAKRQPSTSPFRHDDLYQAELIRAFLRLARRADRIYRDGARTHTNDRFKLRCPHHYTTHTLAFVCANRRARAERRQPVGRHCWPARLTMSTEASAEPCATAALRMDRWTRHWVLLAKNLSFGLPNNNIRHNGAYPWFQFCRASIEQLRSTDAGAGPYARPSQRAQLTPGG